MKRYIAFILIQTFLLPCLSFAQKNKPEILVDQIIGQCIQKQGDSPCVVGVDNRTITYDNRVFEVNDKVIELLGQRFKKLEQSLNAIERRQFKRTTLTVKKDREKTGWD